MNEVYSSFFPDPKPARTTVQVGALPGGIKVEIDCVVVLP
jgi:2-iminobutanoate/2-iminopropanoate deaminase